MLTTGQSFNVVTQQDSHVMINDSKTMKAIAAVTMIFLPATTIAVGLAKSFYGGLGLGEEKAFIL